MTQHLRRALNNKPAIGICLGLQIIQVLIASDVSSHQLPFFGGAKSRTIAALKNLAYNLH